MPSSMPWRTRALYARELPAWGLLPLMTGVIEGGVAGVIVKKVYAGVVTDDLLNLVVALLIGLPALANLLSLAWVTLGHGRHKIRMLLAMQVGCALMVALPALANETPIGLGLFLLGIIGARLCWSGVITFRSAVWAANYPRHMRARVAGKFATIQAIVLASVSAGVGMLMDHDPQAYRWAYPAAAGAGLLGAFAYSRIRMCGHAALLQAELNTKLKDSKRLSMNPMSIIRFLRNDRDFGQFMLFQFLLGTANMMISAPLIIVLADVYSMDYIQMIAMTTSIPIIIMPFVIPMWSRLLDRVHIVRFRSIHSWVFVLTSIILVITLATSWMPGFWIAAAVRGVAFGGGVLAWNLGHHDFSTISSSSMYMGVHVTLTGFRGLIAPALGVGLYELLQHIDPSGTPVFVLSLLLGIAGALGFVWLARRLPDGGAISRITP